MPLSEPQVTLVLRSMISAYAVAVCYELAYGDDFVAIAEVVMHVRTIGRTTRPEKLESHGGPKLLSNGECNRQKPPAALTGSSADSPLLNLPIMQLQYEMR